MKEIKAPNELVWGNGSAVFLAGSIEMGKAETWQSKIVKDLEEYDVVILNPRRDDWDSTWVQSIENAQFRKQVEWELAALDCSDIVVFYFDPKTMSPITLMELGLCAKSHHVIVCCPDGYWRKGNVEVVCSMFDIPLFNTYDELVKNLKEHL